MTLADRLDKKGDKSGAKKLYDNACDHHVAQACNKVGRSMPSGPPGPASSASALEASASASSPSPSDAEELKHRSADPVRQIRGQRLTSESFAAAKRYSESL